MRHEKGNLATSNNFVETRHDGMRAAVIAPQGKTLAGMSEEKIVEQARNYCVAIGADPDRIVTGEDAKKYLDYIGEDVEHARRMGWNTDCWLPLIAFGCALALSACARAPAEPVVDLQGKSEVNYQADLADCRAYAEKVDAGGNAAEGAAVGAVGGALFGALLGAIVHAPAAGAAIGAASGGLGGAGGGLEGSMIRKNVIMRNCLAHRGYTILG